MSASRACTYSLLGLPVCGRLVGCVPVGVRPCFLCTPEYVYLFLERFFPSHAYIPSWFISTASVAQFITHCVCGTLSDPYGYHFTQCGYSAGIATDCPRDVRHDRLRDGLFHICRSDCSFQLNANDSVTQTITQVFATLDARNGTPLGPVHLQIPLDVIGQLANDETVQMIQQPIEHQQQQTPKGANTLNHIQNAAHVINQHNPIVILAGGGAVNAQDQVKQLALALDAPVVTTINGRGLMANHALSVPASPSLEATRSLLAQAHCVIALGTEMGQTDYDMYVNGNLPPLKNLIRIDISPSAIQAPQQLGIHCDVSQALTHLLPLLTHKLPSVSSGEARAAITRQTAFTQLPESYQQYHRFLTTIIQTLPEAIIVGDSTQPVYAGNCYFEAPAAKAWFNSATGFGTLGYAVPAAIGGRFRSQATAEQ